MLPSSTVENYLKAIYVGETHLVGDQKLVPMGQLASALGIAPGTATTMVKALAESGLAVYEPYNGVRLTSASKYYFSNAPANEYVMGFTAITERALREGVARLQRAWSPRAKVAKRGDRG